MKSINDLYRLQPEVKERIHRAVAECVDSGRFVLGDNVKAFEHEFAAYIGTPYCVSVANGTQALELAIKSIDIEAGDEVVTVANAGFYSTCAILACGAVPVFADCALTDFNMESASLKRTITAKTKAVILTHIYGKMGDVSAIADICKKNGLWFIEDCAQAHGAQRHGKKAGSFGDLGCFSFYPTKNLGAMGDGGAVVTANPALMEKIKQLRQYGWKRKYFVDLLHGINSRLDEIQAAVLRVKLQYLDKWNNQRRGIALRYSKGISHPCITWSPQQISEDYVAHLYVLRSRHRDALVEHLRSEGIPSDVHYPVPDYRQKALAGQFDGVALPATEEACSHVLTLPCFPEMSQTETDAVIDAINGWSMP